MSDNWLAEVLHDTMNDESIEGLRARLIASEAREAAYREALERIEKYPWPGDSEDERSVIARNALAQPSAAPSVPREEHSSRSPRRHSLQPSPLTPITNH